MSPRHRTPLTRRKVITGLAGAAVAVPAAALIAPHALASKSSDGGGAKAKAAGALPVTIVNNSGAYDNASVYLYIVGNQDVDVLPGADIPLRQRLGRLHRLRPGAVRQRRDEAVAAVHVRPDLRGPRRQAEVQGRGGRQRQRRPRVPGGLGRVRPELRGTARLRRVHLQRRRHVLQHHDGRHVQRAAEHPAHRRRGPDDGPAARRRPGEGVRSVSFDKPSTRDVLFCDGKPAAPNDGTTGPVAAILGAGFNRSTLISSPSQPTTDPAAFYATELTNHYSKAVHAAMEDGKAYGFAFDDVADFASYVQDHAPTGFRLELTPF